MVTIYNTPLSTTSEKALFGRPGGGLIPNIPDASRTTGGCSAHRISLPYRRSLFFTPNASENASRTPGGLFEHGTHIPYHRRPSPVPNATKPKGEGIACSEYHKAKNEKALPA